jgi:hypothetical protein
MAALRAAVGLADDDALSVTLAHSRPGRHRSSAGSSRERFFQGIVLALARLKRLGQRAQDGTVKHAIYPPGALQPPAHQRPALNLDAFSR